MTAYRRIKNTREIRDKNSKTRINRAYKIMGVTAGRKNSNSEILLKEALMACEELGAEVRMINLKDFHN